MIWQKWRLCELRAICLADLVDGVVHAQVALLDPDRALADALDHAGGEVLHGHVHEVGQLGKLDDLLEVRVDELLGVTEECAVEVDVLAGGELRSSKI